MIFFLVFEEIFSKVLIQMVENKKQYLLESFELFKKKSLFAGLFESMLNATRLDPIDILFGF